MAKKNNVVNRVPIPEPPQASAAQPITAAEGWTLPAWFSSFRFQAIAVAIVAFACYANTFSNEYALDDLIVIVKNEYVYEGFAGLKDIFTKDAFDSYCRQTNSTNQLSGGRYRPLSIATFAVEQQFMGPVPPAMADSVISHALEQGEQQRQLIHNMHTRHVLNVLWFTLSVVVLLLFLRRIVFSSNHIVAFITVLLFCTHPIHTEVVANVKSRDELMSFLFICLTFLFAFRYREERKMWQLALAMLSYFLAFLSKEYAVSLLLLLPLSFYLFHNEDIGSSLKATLPYLAVAGVYFMIRFGIVGAPGANTIEDDVWNNPYALASDTQKLATEIATTLNYLKLLLILNPLSSDYSYNTIAYKTFAHPLVWLSVIVHLGLFTGFFFFFKKRNMLCFAIGFYLFNLLLVCNVLYDIGGTMGERLIYHSSLGFCMAAAWLLYKGAMFLKTEQAAKATLALVVIAVTGLYGFKTIARNPQWKNDYTLFAHDVQTVPNSLLVNANLGSAYIAQSEVEKDTVKQQELIHKAIRVLDKATTIDSMCIPAYLNKGIGYFRLKEADNSRKNYEWVVKHYPQYPPLAELYYNVGVLYYFDKRYTDAIAVWQQVLKLNPGYQQAQQNINIALHDMSMQGLQVK